MAARGGRRRDFLAEKVRVDTPRVPPWRRRAARARCAHATAFDATAVAAMEQLLDFQPTVSAFAGGRPQDRDRRRVPAGRRRASRRCARVDHHPPSSLRNVSVPAVRPLTHISTDASQPQRVFDRREPMTSFLSARERLNEHGGSSPWCSALTLAEDRRAQDDGQPPVPPRAQGQGGDWGKPSGDRARRRRRSSLERAQVR